MMFDTIICEYPLPLPEDLEECEGTNWTELEFQTKSLNDFLLGGMLDSYSIEEDGQLYLNKITRKVTEEGSVEEYPDGVEKQDYTGEIFFYTLILKDKKDYWLEFKALFWKGDLKEVSLEDFKKEDNEERQLSQKKFEKELSQATKRSEEWWFPFYKLYRFCFGLIFWLIRKVLEWELRVLYKIERWLP